MNYSSRHSSIGSAVSDDRSRALDWLLNARTGTAARAMLACLLGIDLKNPYERTEHPRDPSDFRLCLDLLDRFPDWRARLGELGRLSEEWARLVRHWEEIETVCRAEIQAGGETSRRAPRTYVRMKELGL